MITKSYIRKLLKEELDNRDYTWEVKKNEDGSFAVNLFDNQGELAQTENYKEGFKSYNDVKSHWEHFGNNDLKNKHLSVQTMPSSIKKTFGISFNLREEEYDDLSKPIKHRAKRPLIDRSTRESINRQLRKAGLDGNKRFPEVGDGLRIAGEIMRAHGIDYAGILSGDIFLGGQGSRNITVEFVPEYDPPELAGREVENSTLAFSWYKEGGIGTGQERKYELLAYMS